MFSVYDGMEYVELVRSFGKLKTMAYVKYATAATAALVREAFAEETKGSSEQGGGFIKVGW